MLPSRRLRVALVGAMVPLHLRLMDCRKSVPLRPMARTAVPGAGALSVVLWLGVITAGRLIGYR